MTTTLRADETPPLRDSPGLPALTVVLGPARSGKTRWCVDRLRERPSGSWLVVDAGCERVRARAEAAGVPAAAAVDCIFDSDRLIQRFDILPPSRRRPLGPTLQRIFLEEAIGVAHTADGPFGSVARKPGFVLAIASAIRELKLACATPQQIAGAAEAASSRLEDPEFAARLRELAAIWQAYEDLLHLRGRRDGEDRVADATLRAADGLPRDLKRLLVDGRRRIEPLWRRLLATIAAQGCEVIFTLPDDPERPELFASTARTLSELARDFELRIHRLERSAPENVAPALVHLERGLFGRSTQEELPALEESPLALFDAPSPYAEAEMVARELLRRRKEPGACSSRCAVIVRSASLQAPVIASVLRERYGIPTSVRLTAVVGDHPVVQALLALLDIFANDWRRSDLLRYLKSSYAPVDPIAVDLLRRKLERRRVAGGRAAWREIDPATLTNDPDLQARLEALREWDARLNEAERPAHEWAEFLLEIIPDALRIGLRDSDARRAMRAVRRVLLEIAMASRLQAEGDIPFAALARRIAAQASAARYRSGFVEKGVDAVAVMEPDDAHALDVEWCAVMGMVERVFPKRVSEDPFLRDDERLALAEAGGPILPQRRHEADDERLRFYLAATTPTKRLVLSFARATEEQDALPSFYLDDVRALYRHVPALVTTLAEVVPSPGEAATAHESLLAECALSLEGDGSPARSERCEATLASRSLPPWPRIQDVERRERAARQVRFGLTQIETVLQCPFRHYAAHVLKLREETAGAGPTDRGSLYHRALQHALRRFHGAAPGSEELRRALLDELTRALAEHPVDAPPHRVRMMERALRDALSAFADREIRYRTVLNGTPTHYELGFGQPPDPAARDAADEVESPDSPGPSAFDPASTARPLALPPGDDGGPVEVSGVIDRVDLLPDGRAIVMDYKLGAAVDYKAMREGASLQMQAYMLAFEQLWGRPVTIAAIDSSRDGCRSRIFRRAAVDDPQALRPIQGVEPGGVVKPLNEDEHAELIRVAESRMRHAAALLRASEVAPTPGPHCDTCPYTDLCRTDRAGEHDGEPAPTP